MKKTMIFMAVMIFSFGAVKAQNVHFGLKAGANFSNLNSDNFSDSKTKVGFHGGLLAHIHTGNPSWGIQPEIMYSMEGAKYKAGGSDASVNLDFVNIPVLAQYMFANGWRVEAGPQVGFVASAKTKIGNVSTDIKDQVKSVNFSIPVGLGYISSTGLGIDARYNFGISDLNDGGSSKLTANTFQLGLFYQFSGSKVRR